MKQLAWVALSLVCALPACDPREQAEAAAATAPSEQSGSGAPSPSAAGSSATSPASASPFNVAITSSGRISVSQVGGGVVAFEQRGKRMAVAGTGGDLEERAVPSGLPEDIEAVQYVGGRLPESLWLSVERSVKNEQKQNVAPFYRLTKSALREIAEDWEPLVVPFSKKRVLSLSTSSKKLKIKILEPMAKTVAADQPARFVPDEECGKSLKLTEAVALADGEVLAAGRCSMGSEKKSSLVLVRWPAGAAAEPQPTPAPATSAPSADPAAVDAAPAATTTDDAADDKKGAPMKIEVVSTDRFKVRSLAASSSKDVYVLGTIDASKDSRLFRADGSNVSEVALPKLEGAALDLAVTDSGDLWLVGPSAVWKKANGADWVAITLPSGVVAETIVTSGADVWLSGTSSKKSVVLKLGATKALSWP